LQLAGAREVQVPFRKGQSGNVAGRKVGQLNRLTRAVNALAAKHGPNIVKKVIQAAENGDPNCRQLFFRYCLPRLRYIDQPTDRPPVTSAAEAAERIAEIAAKVESGALDLDTGAALVAGMQAFASAKSVSDLERRLDGVLTELAALKAEIKGTP
jgi:hypothetical protein